MTGGPPWPLLYISIDFLADGILTVADDLLKNDGEHFIDMMEQLAERRMQREEETHYPSAALAHQNFHQGHNHPPLDEEDDYDDDDIFFLGAINTDTDESRSKKKNKRNTTKSSITEAATNPILFNLSTT